MRNLWQKIKSFFSRIWHGLTVAGRIIAGLIILGLVGLTVYAATNDTDKKDSEKSSEPEVAQVYEPSIGSPLPPDNSGNDGASVTASVAGESTTVASNNESPMTTTKNVVTEDMKIAPPTGVDPNAPIKYQNDQYQFAAVLPAGSNVSEKNGQVEFRSTSGKLQYLVSIHDSTDTLANIEAQLRNSSTASGISPTKFAGQNALRFNAAGYGSGIVFVANGKTYYLLGDSHQFDTFKTI
jgi:uncharacterized protein YfiM (DUF2279 family)